jgi:acetyltransferase-like isoleucine patch superfamily enzyme
MTDWERDCLDSYHRRREEMRAEWQRDLPFDELLFDRWERARALGFGEGASIYHTSYVYGDVSVGDKTWIGPHTLLDGSGGGLRIGAYCSISAGVQIYTHNTVRWALSRGAAEYDQAPTIIGDCCYLGPYAVVSKGVTIGSHSVVGAHTLVNRDVEAYSIVFGVPGRVVGRVEVDEAGAVRLVYSESRHAFP